MLINVNVNNHHCINVCGGIHCWSRGQLVQGLNSQDMMHESKAKAIQILQHVF